MNMMRTPSRKGILAVHEWSQNNQPTDPQPNTALAKAVERIVELLEAFAKSPAGAAKACRLLKVECKVAQQFQERHLASG